MICLWIEKWRNSSSPVIRSLAFNSVLSILRVTDIKFTGGFIFSGCFCSCFICFFCGKPCSAGTWGAANVRWSVLTRKRLCWLWRPPEEGGNYICQDKEGGLGATTSFLFRLPFFPFPSLSGSGKAWEKKTTGGNRLHTRKTQIRQNWCALWNLYIPALAWGVLCP